MDHLLQNKYRVQQVIGQGGMGKVYLAQDIEQNRMVAIKQMILPTQVLETQVAQKREAIKRFKREYQFLSTITYENVVKAYDFFENQDGYFLVLEYVAGVSFDHFIVDQSKKLGLFEKLIIAIQIVRAVEVINTAGIIHRDIKPSNIVIDCERGIIKLLDLGVAKSQELSTITVSDMQVGTPGYMSPEQGDGKVEENSDVFSLGAMLYQFFLGWQNSPFKGPDRMRTLLNIGEKNLPHLIKEIQKDLNETERKTYKQLSLILDRALQKDPEMRTLSAKILANELEHVYYNLQKEAPKNTSHWKIPIHLTDSQLKVLNQFKQEHRSTVMHRINKTSSGRRAAKSKRLRRKDKVQGKKTIPQQQIIVIVSIVIVLAIVFMAIPANQNKQKKEDKKISSNNTKKTFSDEKKSAKNDIDSIKDPYQKILTYMRNGMFQEAWLENKKAYTQNKESKFQAIKGYMIFMGFGRQIDKNTAGAILQKCFADLNRSNDHFSVFAVGFMYYHGIGGVTIDGQMAQKKFLQAYQLGNSFAPFFLGNMYKSGKFVLPNRELAIAWFKKSCVLENTLAMTNLGSIYQDQDINKALELYIRAARLGNVTSMYNLGLIYEPKDPQQAFYWYEKSAQRGDPRSMNNLAGLYEGKRGISANINEAIKWYTKAADIGLQASMANLGLIYFNRKNYPQSLMWYTKAAQLGNVQAMSYLGVMHAGGYSGVAKNISQAIHWNQQASQRGDKNAMFNLGNNYESINNKTLALEWYIKAANAGHLEVLFKLGHWYYQEKQFTKSLEWYQKGIERGNVKAMISLASLYEKGFASQKPDARMAIELLTKACNLGSPIAMFNLGVIYYKGEIVAQDEQQAYKWIKAASNNGLPQAKQALQQFFQNK